MDKELTTEQKKTIKSKLEKVFKNGGYALIATKEGVDGDNVTLAGSAYVGGLHPIIVIESVINTMNLTHEQVVLLFSKVVEDIKKKADPSTL